MSDVDHWHPYMPPLDWLRWWQGGPACWTARDRDAAHRVIYAAEAAAHDRADVMAATLAGTRWEVHQAAKAAVYFLAASFSVSPGRDALLADLASDASVGTAEVLALADALADYLPDVDAGEDTGLRRQMAAVSAATSAPLAKHLAVAVRLLGLLWRERPGTFAAFYAAYGQGRVE